MAEAKYSKTKTGGWLADIMTGTLHGRLLSLQACHLKLMNTMCNIALKLTLRDMTPIFDLCVFAWVDIHVKDLKVR